MALTPDSLSLSLAASGVLAKAQRAVGSFFMPAPQPYSVESQLRDGTLRDARLAPRAPMTSDGLDVGLLTQLSQVGLKRGKQVNAASHPELMQAWNAMASRAGLPTPPQLIIAESDALNALTVTKQEVVITTGLLKILDLRETVAVLGHELGHVQSDHTRPRAMWMGGLGAIGAWAGNEFGRAGGANMLLAKAASKWPVLETIRGFFYRGPFVGHPSSLLGSSLYVAAGVGVGATIGKHASVRPTELDADAKGAFICGDAAGLAMALQSLDQHVKRSGLAQTVGLLRSGYPSMQRRITSLQRMAEQSPQRSVLDSLPPVPPAPVAAPEAQTAAAAPSAQPSASVHQAAAAGRVGTAVTAPALG